MASLCLKRQAPRDRSTHAMQVQRIRQSNAPVVRLRLVLHLSYERSGISTDAAESG